MFESDIYSSDETDCDRDHRHRHNSLENSGYSTTRDRDKETYQHNYHELCSSESEEMTDGAYEDDHLYDCSDKTRCASDSFDGHDFSVNINDSHITDISNILNDEMIEVSKVNTDIAHSTTNQQSLSGITKNAIDCEAFSEDPKMHHVCSTVLNSSIGPVKKIDYLSSSDGYSHLIQAGEHTSSSSMLGGFKLIQENIVSPMELDPSQRGTKHDLSLQDQKGSISLDMPCGSKTSAVMTPLQLHPTKGQDGTRPVGDLRHASLVLLSRFGAPYHLVFLSQYTMLPTIPMIWNQRTRPPEYHSH